MARCMLFSVVLMCVLSVFCVCLLVRWLILKCIIDLVVVLFLLSVSMCLVLLWCIFIIGWIMVWICSLVDRIMLIVLIRNGVLLVVIFIMLWLLWLFWGLIMCIVVWLGWCCCRKLSRLSISVVYLVGECSDLLFVVRWVKKVWIKNCVFWRCWLGKFFLLIFLVIVVVREIFLVVWIVFMVFIV